MLDGQKWLAPCGDGSLQTFLACTEPGYGQGGTICPLGAAGAAYIDRGLMIRNDTLTFGGTAGKTYDVTVRIRGVVETKHYLNGVKDTAHDGFYVGGEPMGAGYFGVYMLWVSAPTVQASALGPGQYFYLNAIDHNEGYFSFPVDYTVTISIAAGAEVRFLVNDPNCMMSRNCDANSVSGGTPTTGVCNTITLPDPPAAVAQPYDGQFIVMNVVSAVER